MNSKYKSKSILAQIDYLESLKPNFERNILISRLRHEVEQIGEKGLKLNFVKHNMNIDIYEIIGKDLYGHMSRLIDTMNENNVVDFDMLSVGRTAKYQIKKDLTECGILKPFKKKDVSIKIYMNPLFGLKNRVYPGKNLIKEFKEVNKKLYNIKL